VLKMLEFTADAGEANQAEPVGLRGVWLRGSVHYAKT